MKTLSVRSIAIAFVSILVLVGLCATALAYMDYFDPEPVVTTTQTSEPIGAQHPRSASASSEPMAADKP